jgi:hypothetical protein
MVAVGYLAVMLADRMVRLLIGLLPQTLRHAAIFVACLTVDRVDGPGCAASLSNGSRRRLNSLCARLIMFRRHQGHAGLAPKLTPEFTRRVRHNGARVAAAPRGSFALAEWGEYQ